MVNILDLKAQQNHLNYLRETNPRSWTVNIPILHFCLFSVSLLWCRQHLRSSTRTLWWGALIPGKLYFGTTGATRGPQCRGLLCQQQHTRYCDLGCGTITHSCSMWQQQGKVDRNCLCSTLCIAWMWLAPRTPTIWSVSLLMARCAPGVWTCSLSHR